MMRTLGIDYGERRVGVAISDPFGSIALGLCTLQVTGMNNAVTQVSEICKEKDVQTVVVGLPLNMNGSVSEMSEKVEKFIVKLTESTGLNIVTSDERLSSAMVERTLLDADMSRTKRKGVIDKLAAQVILQGYLDRQAFENGDDMWA
jgi:putative Holliday junction resolvase